MAQRVCVTGGSGFVGSAVIAELLARGYGINAIVNRRPISVAGDVRSIQADLFDQPALRGAMKDCCGVIHLIGIIREWPGKGITFQKLHVEATRAVLAAARSAQIPRYVHMSAQGTRPNAASLYHQTKWAAEELVRTSGLAWTIFRPSLIHGVNGEFSRLEEKWARKKAPPFLFMPYFGRGLFGAGGAGLLQPVHVNDVARAFVDALERPATIGKTYSLGGSQVLTWPQMHQIAAKKAVGHRRWVMPLPAWYAQAIAAVVPAKMQPFSRDQVVMALEDNTCDMPPFTADFGWVPASFAETFSVQSQ